MASLKRIRFGVVFKGERPNSDLDFFRALDVVHAEGVEQDAMQFMMFTLQKPRRTVDVEHAMQGMQLIEFDGMPKIVTFERGHRYQTHPIFQTIQALSKHQSFWTWKLEIDGDQRRKRVISELESDLVNVVPECDKREPKKKESFHNENGDRGQPQVRDVSSPCAHGLQCIGMN